MRPATLIFTSTSLTAILLVVMSQPVAADSGVDGTYNVLQGADTARGAYSGSARVVENADGSLSIRGRYRFRSGGDHRFDGNGQRRGGGLSFTVTDRRSPGAVDVLAELLGLSRPEARTTTWTVTYAPLDDYLNGKWVSSDGNRRSDRWYRITPVITALQPKEIAAGRDGVEVTVIGRFLPLNPAASTISFIDSESGHPDRYIDVTRVRGTSDDRTQLRLVLNVNRRSKLGFRDLRIGDTTGRRLARVTPPPPRLKLGVSNPRVKAGQRHELFVPLADGTLSFNAAVKVISSNDAEVPASEGSYIIAKAGWYQVIPGASGDLTPSYRLEGRSAPENMPWHFWYFPYVKSADPAENLYSDAGAYEKLDQAMGIKHRALADPFTGAGHMDGAKFTMPTTPAEKAPYVTDTTKGYAWCYQRSTDKDKYWWGHCWGAVVASSLYQQPEAVTLKDGEGNPVVFNQEEVEGLLSSWFTDHGILPRRFLDRCPAARPKQATGEACDRYADDYFLGLLQGIGKEGLALASNLRAESTSTDPKDMNQVWNHVIYAYQASVREAAGNDPLQIEVSLRIEATEDVFPSPPNAAGRDENYVMQFKCQAEGGIARDAPEQNWISADHYTPSYLWKITRSASGSRSTKNRVLGQRVGLAKLEQLFKYKKHGR